MMRSPIEPSTVILLAIFGSSLVLEWGHRPCLSFVNAFTAPSGLRSKQLLRGRDIGYWRDCIKRDDESAVPTSTTSLTTRLDASSSLTSSSDTDNTGAQKKEDRMKQIRKEGGLLSFNTKFGAANLYSLYYGLVAVLLGIPWYLGMLGCQLLYFVSGGRIDKKKRAITFLTHLWGTSLMTLSRSWPKVRRKEILKQFYEQNRPAMFVANHVSWMDIPFLGSTIGWRNYKMISKKELGRVPILGKAIKIGGHVMVDRTNRRSQLETLKLGISRLKDDNVHLCTFPEGTRSKDGRLMNFKNGAFKMAYKAGAPVIPLSIVGAQKVHPSHWLFPIRPAHGNTEVIIHDPIEPEGKTEEELAEAVREAMMSGLPPEQRPVETDKK